MIAYDQDGEPFAPPERAKGWRVTFSNRRGHPTVLAGEDGTPLIAPLEVEPDELREVLEELGLAKPGRYRLAPVDEYGRVCGERFAYWTLAGAGGAGAAAQSDPALRAALEANTAMCGTMGTVMQSLAAQLTAAMEGSAKASSLRARHAVVEETALVPMKKGDQGEDEDKARHVVDWTPVLAELAPMLGQLGKYAAMAAMRRVASPVAETAAGAAAAAGAAPAAAP